MSRSFDFKAPDFFTAGTVGPPGQRVFYLQAREAGIVATLKLEKEHVGALAEYLADLLARLGAATETVAGDLALLEPIAPDWVVRSLGAGYDQALERFVIVAEELVDEEAADEEASGEAASARFQVTRTQAAAFVERAQALMKAARPSCRVCGRPKNPGGHVCAGSNGHGRD